MARHHRRALPVAYKSTFELWEETVLVTEVATPNFVVYQDGLEQRLSKAGDHLVERYGAVTQELQGSWLDLRSSLSEQAHEVTQQARGRLQHGGPIPLVSKWKGWPIR